MFNVTKSLNYLSLRVRLFGASFVRIDWPLRSVNPQDSSSRFSAAFFGNLIIINTSQ